MAYSSIDAWPADRTKRSRFGPGGIFGIVAQKLLPQHIGDRRQRPWARRDGQNWLFARASIARVRMVLMLRVSSSCRSASLLARHHCVSLRGFTVRELVLRIADPGVLSMIYCAGPRPVSAVLNFSGGTPSNTYRLLRFLFLASLPSSSRMCLTRAWKLDLFRMG